MPREIELKLSPDQRFLMESQNDEALIFVDTITVMPNGSQILFSGKIFWTDAADMTISDKGNGSINVSYSENATYRDEDE